MEIHPQAPFGQFYASVVADVLFWQNSNPPKKKWKQTKLRCPSSMKMCILFWVCLLNMLIEVSSNLQLGMSYDNLRSNSIPPSKRFGYKPIYWEIYRYDQI